MNRPSTSGENDLARRFRRGNPEAAEEICRRHASGLYALARSLGVAPDPAQDLVQETFMRALRYRRSLDPRRPVRPWLATTLRRIWIRQAERDGIDAPPGDEFDPDLLEGSGEDPQAAARCRELRRRVLGLLGAVSPRRRQAVLLRLLGELGQAEIAAELDVPVGTVGYWLHEELARLRSALETEAPRPRVEKADGFSRD